MMLKPEIDGGVRPSALVVDILVSFVSRGGDHDLAGSCHGIQTYIKRVCAVVRAKMTA